MGRTTRRWVRYLEEPAYLANTGLNVAVSGEVLTLGTAAMPHFNVADRVGAFGYAFRDRITGEIIAFRQTSTFITGGLNDWTSPTRFNATNGISYSANFTASPGAVLMRNGVETGNSTGSLRDAIVAIAGSVGYTTATNAPDMLTDGRQVVMAVDIVGATITRVYSINGWAVDEAFVATATDLRTIDADGALFGLSFPENHNQDIDYRMFQLIGVDCLRDISADDVVYVYSANDVITRVAVGSEVVEGVMTDANNLRFIVGGRSINYAHRFLTTGTRWSATYYGDVMSDAGSDVTVRLDAFGNAFEITLGATEVGNFGIVRSATGNDPRGHGAVLFTNDGAAAFYNIIGGTGIRHFAPRAVQTTIPRRGTEMPNRVFNETQTAQWQLIDTNLPAVNTVVPQLIGFGLNAAGNINMIERAAAGTIDVRSRTVARITTAGATRDLPIDANAAIFWEAPAGTWNVGTVDDIRLARFREAGFGPNAGQQYILNVAGTRVVAFTLGSDWVAPTSTDMFALINNWDYRDGYQRLHGFFNNESGHRDTTDTAPTFHHGLVTHVALWQMEVNAAGEIRDAWDLTANDPLAVRFVTRPTEFPGATMTAGADALGLQLADRNHVSLANNTLTPAGGANLITLYPDAVVYRATMAGGRVQYAVSSLAAIPHSAWVWGYNTAAELTDVTSSATVLIWMHNNDIPGGWVTAPPPVAPVVIESHPASANRNPGESVSFTVAAVTNPAGGALTFTWQQVVGGSWVAITDGGAISGATTATLTVDPIMVTSTFRVIVSDGTVNVTSNPATVTLP